MFVDDSLLIEWQSFASRHRQLPKLPRMQSRRRKRRSEEVRRSVSGGVHTNYIKFYSPFFSNFVFFNQCSTMFYMVLRFSVRTSLLVCVLDNGMNVCYDLYLFVLSVTAVVVCLPFVTLILLHRGYLIEVVFN